MSPPLPNTVYDAALGKLQYCNGTSLLDIATGGGSGSGGSGNTMVSGWPDAIVCNVTNPNWGPTVLYAMAMPYQTSTYIYRFNDDSGSTLIDVRFGSSGAFSAYGGITTSNCNKSISQLYTDGQAFNFVGGASAAAAGSAGQLQFYSGGNLAADSALTWDNTNKRLGIGTTTVPTQLTLANAGESGIRMIGNGLAVSATRGLFVGYNAGGYIWNHEASPLLFATNGAERMRIDSSGNVGIGTSSPGTELEIAAASPKLRLSDSDVPTAYVDFSFADGGGAGADPQLDINAMGDATAAANIRFFRNTNTSAATRVMILKGDNTATANASIAGNGNTYFAADNGNVGIGTAAPGYKLHVNGEIAGTQLAFSATFSSGTTLCQASASGFYYTRLCTSLGKFKLDQRNLELGLDDVLKLRPVSFTWDKEHGGRRDLGFIAEEVEKLSPLLSEYDAEGQLLGVKYKEMTSLLTKAVQQLKSEYDNNNGVRTAQIKALQDANDDMAAENAVLRKQVDHLTARMNFICSAMQCGDN